MQSPAPECSTSGLVAAAPDDLAGGPALGSAAQVSRPTRCLQCPLRRLETFRPNTVDEVAFIQHLKVGEVRLAARAAIVEEGSRNEQLYTMLSGWAFRHKTLPDGRRQILNFLLPGDLVGLQARLFDEAEHGIESLTDVVLCCFSRERVWEIFRDHPRIAFDVTWLGAREEALVDDGLLSTGRRTALERTAALLLQLHDRARGVGLGRDGGGVELPLTQVHLADALGLSYVHVNRTMQSLRRLGMVTLAAGVLRLPKPDTLRRIARTAPVSRTPRPLI